MPAVSVGRITCSIVARPSASTSAIDRSTVLRLMPTPAVRLACGSMSMRRTRKPSSASAPARLIAVVVLPTPPFWLAIAITCGQGRHLGIAWGATEAGGTANVARILPRGPSRATDEVVHTIDRVVHRSVDIRARFAWNPSAGMTDNGSVATVHGPLTSRQHGRRRRCAPAATPAVRRPGGPMMAASPCASLRKDAAGHERREPRTCRRTRNGSRGSSGCARNRSRVGERSASSASTRWASSPRASGWTCCSTRARSWSSTRSSPTGRRSSGSTSQHVLGDGVVTGHGTIDGRLVFVFSQDFTVFGGSLSEAYAEKICKVMDLAMKVGAPVIGLNDSGGARIQEGVASLGGYAEIFLRNVLASGVVPQISVILGPCAGGAVYSPAMTDFTVMVEGTSYMFVTGPNVVKRRDPRGGRRGVARRRGGPHRSERRRASRGRATRPRRWTRSAGCSRTCRRTTSPTRRSIASGDPRDRMDAGARRGRARRVVEAVRHARRPPARRRRRRVPRDPAGVGRRTSSSASRGSAGARSASSRSSPRCSPARSTSTPRSRPRGSSGRATRSTCRSSPSSTCPGSCPASRQEHGGIIRHGAKLLYAYCEATVPKVTVITRKAYGGAYDVMSSKHIRGDMNFAWPTAEIAVMGAEGAVNIIFKDAIAGADDPAAERRRLVDDVRGRVLEPVRRGGARLHRRGDPAARDAPAADPRPRGPRRQAGHQPAQEAWQHPALTRAAGDVFAQRRAPPGPR